MIPSCQVSIVVANVFLVLVALQYVLQVPSVAGPPPKVVKPHGKGATVYPTNIAYKAAGVYRRSHDGKSSVVALDAHLAPVFTYHASSNTFGFNARNVHMSSKIGTRPRNNLLYRDL
jgi:hypothetical protein